MDTHAPPAFALYVRNTYDKVTGSSAPVRMRKLARQWEALSESAKRPFIRKATSLAARHHRYRFYSREDPGFHYWLIGWGAEDAAPTPMDEEIEAAAEAGDGAPKMANRGSPLGRPVRHPV